MILHSLGIENFKAFGTMQRLRLRPLTLLYGPNSSGKSSILHVLGLCRQSFGQRSPDVVPYRLSPRGPIVDLGNYEGMVHGQDPKRDVTFEFEVQASPDPRPDSSGRQADPVRLTLSYEIDDRLQRDITGRRAYEGPAVLNHLKFLMEGPSGDPRGWTLRRRGTDPGRSQEDHLLLLFPGSEALALEHGWDARYLESPSRGPVLCSRVGAYVERESWLKPVWLVSASEGSDAGPTPSILPQMRAINTLNDLFSRIQYLGPLREPPRRHYFLEPGPTGSVGARGEAAPTQLILRRERTLGGLNEWLERLGIPYSLDCDVSGNQVTGALVTLTLTPERGGPGRSDLRVAPTDVGFGIGQVLPILIQGLLRPPSLIAVEQPELHLHPRLQGELADFFLATALPGRGEFRDEEDDAPHQWVVETHSEALMLRVQRRIREGVVSSSDVAVYYVLPPDADHSESTIMELRLDEDGQFLDEWPDGFFEEGYLEIFGGTR